MPSLPRHSLLFALSVLAALVFAPVPGLRAAKSTVVLASAEAREPEQAGGWIATWVSSQQLVEPANQAPVADLAGMSLRQIVQPSLSGRRVRVRLSNQYGDRPLILSGLGIAKSAGGSAIRSATYRALRFGGTDSVVIRPGAQVLSDEVDLDVQAFDNLCVGLRFASAPSSGHQTGHPGSRTTSYLASGAALDAPSWDAPLSTDHWYFVASVEVQAERAAAGIVVLGDSITDGRGSTTNANDRWPNLLARRLHTLPGGAMLSVLNQGVGGGRVLQDGLGESALRRFDRDVLAVPGVCCLVIAEGVNDLGTAAGARAKLRKAVPADSKAAALQSTEQTSLQPVSDSAELTAAYVQLIRRAHAAGLRVVGVTILPFKGFEAYFNEETEAERQRVNDWIRHSGAFDAVIDFDALGRDPADPQRLRADLDGGDHLHPSAAGYRVLAEGIDLGVFAPLLIK